MRHTERISIALAIALSIALPAAAVPAHSELRGTVYETRDADQATAETIFARSEAAAYFTASRRVRWLTTDASVATPGNSTPRGIRGLDEFAAELERDFPRFRENAHGPYLLKTPAEIGKVDASTGDDIPAAPLATVFTESFESGMTNWTITNNTSDLYSWGATTCEARTGLRSADAMRGGTNALTCSDAYGANVTTMMVHKSCEAIQGASQAWLDAFIRLGTESGYDKLGFYYADASGAGYGYEFTGSAGAWYHLVFNLRQWYRAGDLTTASCPRLAIQFYSNAATQSGIGARIDDITIGTSAPTFLTAAIAATPSTGAVPLTVNLTSSVTGATAAATYLWSFGDAAATTATTPNTSFTYTTAGDYWPRLTVTDSGVRAAAQTLVRASAVPTCTVTCTATVPATATAGAAALFQGTATATGCSGTASYSWNFGDGQTSGVQNASHAYSNAGSYNWTLTTSVGGTSCTKSGTIVVGAAARSRLRAATPPSPITVASGSIGPSGGSLSGGGVTLTIPAGTLSSASTIALRRLITGGRESGVVTDTFGITGLPSKLSGALTIEMDVSGSSLGAAEKYYIAATAGMYAKSYPAEEQDVVRIVPIAATQSGSRISVTLPANWAMPKMSNVTGVVEAQRPQPLIYTGDFVVRGEKKTYLETDHFSATAVSSDAAAAKDILAILEGHYKTITDLGFSFDCRNVSGTFRKIGVVPRAMGGGDDAKLGTHISGGDPCGANLVFTSDYLEITTSYPVSNQNVSGAAAHELFHLVQDIYSPGGARANLWLKEASSIWLENALGLCPDIQNAYKEFAFNGLFNSRNSAVPGWWATTREARHGYGASYFLRYRTDHGSGSSDRFIFNVWSQIRAGNSELAAIQAALGTSLPDYWSNFAKAYYAAQTSARCFVNAYAFEFREIAGEKSLPVSYTFDGYPLSAHSWLLNLSKFQSDAAQPATIRSYGLISGQKVIIYDSKSDSELATLTSDNVKYEIPDLRSLGRTFLIAWFIDTNLPPAGSNDISSTNVVALSFGDETKLAQYPWSFQSQWDDEHLGPVAVWTSAGSGVVDAPKGCDVTVDASTLKTLPKMNIRCHGAIGKVVVSGSFLVSVNPTSGRKTNADGSYNEFAYTNPRFAVDYLGVITGGSNFRYEIPPTRDQAGQISSYQFDASLKCFDKTGKQYACEWFTGVGYGMIIDFERNQ